MQGHWNCVCSADDANLDRSAWDLYLTGTHHETRPTDVWTKHPPTRIMSRFYDKNNSHPQAHKKKKRRSRLVFSVAVWVEVEGLLNKLKKTIIPDSHLSRDKAAALVSSEISGFDRPSPLATRGSTVAASQFSSRLFRRRRRITLWWVLAAAAQ